MHLLWRTGTHYHCLRGNTPHPVCVCACVKREDVCVNDDNGERWSHLTGFKLHSITTNLPCKGKSNQYVRHTLTHHLFTPFLISLPHPLTFPPLTPSPPHSFTSPPPPTYTLASLPKEHVLPVHCTRYEGSPHQCQLHRIR